MVIPSLAFVFFNRHSTSAEKEKYVLSFRGFAIARSLMRVAFTESGELI